MMASPRGVPAVRPMSPLSPGYGTSHPPSSPRSMQTRTSSKQRRRPTPNSLKLPPLPRFHPANFPSSQGSSLQATPDGQSPNQRPMSPRSHQRMYSDAQRQLYTHQHELYISARASATHGGKPISPRLVPLAGSPGAMTPLELEGEDGYMLVGQRHVHAKLDSRELADELIREEARRQSR